jgi:hypothetical protein
LILGGFPLLKSSSKSALFNSLNKYKSSLSITLLLFAVLPACDSCEPLQKITGECKTYYESGNLKEEKNYQDGKLHGVAKTYYESGNLEQDGNYKDGEFHRIVKTYYENGTLRGEANFKDGELQLHGIVKSYFENGNL